MVKKKDKYKENACEFKNEQYCEEELDEEGTSVDEAETEHFDEKEEDAWEE
ncbi:Uncharacterised protein [uncultured archaeon]|nr:Uncharacterised protein [uncultured archaeon]